EPGKTLTGTWNVVDVYQLSVYGPNGFARFFNGSNAAGAAALDVRVKYGKQDSRASIECTIHNAGDAAEVSVLDAYTGNVTTQRLSHNAAFVDKLSLDQFHGWYDLTITVAGDQNFRYRLAGHVETGNDSFSDPALGGLVSPDTALNVQGSASNVGINSDSGSVIVSG